MFSVPVPHPSSPMPKECLACGNKRCRVRLRCGHLSTCAECTALLRQCPLCKHPIPFEQGIPGGWISSGSSGSTFARRPSSPTGPACFQLKCTASPQFDYCCPTCRPQPDVASSDDVVRCQKIQYSLCSGCARDWVCPFCGVQADERQLFLRDGGTAGDEKRSSTTSTPGRRDKCYDCRHEDAVVKFRCPVCGPGFYMLCALCGPSFVCPRCSTAVASPDDLIPDSDHTPTSSAASTGSSRQPVEDRPRPRPQVQHGGGSSSSMPL